MEPCTVSKFNKVFKDFDFNFTDRYSRLSLDEWICPVDDYNITLAGTYSCKDR